MGHVGAHASSRAIPRRPHAESQLHVAPARCALPLPLLDAFQRAPLAHRYFAHWRPRRYARASIRDPPARSPPRRLTA
eukprot:7076689-Prymnesium_polylepis.1